MPISTLNFAAVNTAAAGLHTRAATYQLSAAGVAMNAMLSVLPILMYPFAAVVAYTPPLLATSVGALAPPPRENPPSSRSVPVNLFRVEMRALATPHLSAVHPDDVPL